MLDNPLPPDASKHWSPWIPTELYGTVNGEPAPWDGEVAFNPAKHARHVCVRQRRRISWIIRQKGDDL